MGGNQNLHVPELQVDVVIVDGAQHMATTSFQAAKRGVHPATNTLFKTVPRCGP
jgi:hypothetical protein